MPSRQRQPRRARGLWLGGAVVMVTVGVAGCGTSETRTVTAPASSLGQPIGAVQGSPSSSPGTSARGTLPRQRSPEAIQLPSAPSPTTPRARAILATASRFATAYLRYQIGRDPPAVRRAIRATCTQGFAHRLLSEPVSLPNAQRANPIDQPAALDHLTYTGPAALGPGPPVQIVLARYHTIRHPGVSGLLTVEVAGTGSSWRVTGLG